MTDHTTVQPKVALDNVYKAYGDNVVLDDVSLHVAEGEVVAALDP